MTERDENHFTKSWEETKIEGKSMDMLTDRRIKSNIEKRIRNKRILNIGIYSAVAAVLVGLLISIFPITNLDSQKSFNYSYSSSNVSKKVVLPDGSHVILEPHSTLVLAEDFNTKERNVNFKGKGVFDIAKNISKPFNINAENFTVQVLGTKFYLDQTTGKSKVDLYEGKVKVNHQGNITFLLPNESWEETIEVISESKPKINLLESKHFSFNDEVLEDIIDEIEITYQINIIYPKEYSKNRIKGSFSGNLEEVLIAIGYPLNLKPQKLSEHKIELK